MSLYERDFYLWTQQQSELLKSGALSQIDVVNLIEEIESMVRSEKKELKLKRHLRNNPSLKSILPEAIDDAYESARIRAMRETNLSEMAFPLTCPYDIRQVLGE